MSARDEFGAWPEVAELAAKSERFWKVAPGLMVVHDENLDPVAMVFNEETAAVRSGPMGPFGSSWKVLGKNERFLSIPRGSEALFPHFLSRSRR